MVDWYHRFTSVGDFLKHTAMFVIIHLLLFPFAYAAIFFATHHSYFLVVVIGGIHVEVTAVYIWEVVMFIIDSHRKRKAKNLPSEPQMLYYLADKKEN